jgi:hypothetical protein
MPTHGACDRCVLNRSEPCSSKPTTDNRQPKTGGRSPLSGPIPALPKVMQLETIPLIIGVLVALFGLGLIFDAWTPDDVIVKHERRRRPRIERSRAGEALVGLGVIGMGAAFIGRDTWKYSVVAVIAGIVLLIWGAILNRQYFGQVLSSRGALRRRDSAEAAAERAKSNAPLAPSKASTSSPPVAPITRDATDSPK